MDALEASTPEQITIGQHTLVSPCTAESAGVRVCAVCDGKTPTGMFARLGMCGRLSVGKGNHCGPGDANNNYNNSDDDQQLMHNTMSWHASLLNSMSLLSLSFSV